MKKSSLTGATSWNTLRTLDAFCIRPGGLMALNLSRYTVVSERRPDNTWVLMHGITGAMDVVTAEVVAALCQRGPFRGSQGVVHHPEIDAARPATLSSTELAYLADRGYLTDVSDEEEMDLVAVAASVLHDKAAQTPSFLALPTLDCNYRCTYCFERPVQLNLRRPGIHHPELEIKVTHDAGNVVMGDDIVDAMFEAIAAAKRAHGDRRNGGQIVLYGGEPLDVANEAVVRRIVETGRSLGFTFSAITNGHDLHHFFDLCGPGGIEQLQVSIDGPQRVHDRRRIALGPDKSYARVTTNVAQLLAIGGTLVQIRVHVDKANIADFEELIQTFDEWGWLGHPEVIIYANTVYEMTPRSVGSDLRLDEIDARLRDLTKGRRNLFLNAPAVNTRAKFLAALGRGDPVPPQGNYCTANTGQYVFAPDGHMYSCWESVGKADSRIGRFHDPERGAVFEIDRVRAGAWFSRHAGLIPECRACPMALVCGGGCAQFSLYQNGSQLTPYCDNFDALFRQNLADIADAYVSRLEDEAAGRFQHGLVAANYG